MPLTLRTRILLVLLLVSSILGATTFFVFQYVLLPKFAELERRHVQTNIERVMHALENELHHLDTLLNDWSAWDDTYKYAADYNVAYEISNLTVSSHLNNQINLLMILDSSGRKIWGNVINEAFEQSIVAKPFDQSVFPRTFPLMQYASPSRPLPKQTVTGLVTTSAGLILCAARPIIDSNDRGPSRGTIIMGRFLGTSLQQKIARLTGLPFEAKPLYEPVENREYGQLGLLHPPYEVRFEAGEEVLHATTMVEDLAGNPLLEIRLNERRDIVLQGLEALRAGMLFSFCGVIVAMAIMVLMLQRSVVSPLQRITRNIAAHRHAKQDWQTLDMTVCASKELCLLNEEFNALMNSLNAKQTELTEAHFNLLKEAKKLKQAESHLKSLDKMKSEFISTAAHELRTPIASIMGYTELLSDDELMATLTDGQKADFYQEIIQNSERLTKIIDDVLDVSRIEAGQRIPLTKEQVSLEEILTKSANRFRLKARQQIAIELASDLPQTFAMDRHRIYQVVDNLLSNAIKYSAADSVIEIQAKRAGRHCQIAITDQGIGMNEEQVQRVFDKFYRADTTDTAVRGLGLGMSIVKQIVEDHGGTIWVDSVINEGTRVYFTLPLDNFGKARA